MEESRSGEGNWIIIITIEEKKEREWVEQE